MVDERKAALQAQRLLSGVVVPSVTDMEQAIDSWIEVCEHHAERSEADKLESTEVKKEQAVAEAIRDSISKRLSKKRDFQSVVEAHEVVDLMDPGDVRQERRQIQQNLHASRSISAKKAHILMPHLAS